MAVILRRLPRFLCNGKVRLADLVLPSIFANCCYIFFQSFSTTSNLNMNSGLNFGKFYLCGVSILLA